MSNKKLPPPADFDVNPERTAEDFAQARPGRDLPADILAAFPQTSPRPPTADRRPEDPRSIPWRRKMKEMEAPR